MICKVSVIIPVYNAARYLRECLDSVVNQTLKEIEIICVDDGSTDNSLAILQEYAAKDKRLLILEQSHSGAGAARNWGIYYASGKYLSIVDADDILKQEFLQQVYQRAEKANADITICRFETLNMKTKQLETENFPPLPAALSNKEVFSSKDISHFIFQFTDGCCWDKLYRRDFIQQYQLQFQNLYRQNDVYFVMLSLALASRMTILDSSLIIHRRRAGKSTTDRRIKEPLCFIPALLALKEGLLRHKLYEDLESSYVNFAVKLSLWMLRSGIPSGLRVKIEQALPSKLFQQLNVREKDASFFHQPEYYHFVQRCLHFNPPTWYDKIFSLRTSLDGRYKILYLCCGALSFKNKRCNSI